MARKRHGKPDKKTVKDMTDNELSIEEARAIQIGDEAENNAEMLKKAITKYEAQAVREKDRVKEMREERKRRAAV